MASVYSSAVSLLRSGKEFALAVIISQDGSTPRGTGSKMIITPDSIIATVGGGGVEAEVIRIAREEVLVKHRPVIRNYNLNSKEAAISDFICGGVCEILVCCVSPDDEYALKVFEAAEEAELRGTKSWFFYIVDTDEQSPSLRLCVSAGGKLFGEFEGDENFSREFLLSPIRAAVHGDMVGTVRYVCEDIVPAGNMLIFGGGHVSRETAALAARCGFAVTVIDDRLEFCNAERFPACRTVVIESFDRIPEFTIDDNTCILIITRGHAHDRTVLEWSLDKSAKYVGMIGSRTKRDKLYENLAAEGKATTEKLRSVHCPIGLSIGAETPEEIAVSIIAEVISVCRGKK